MQTSDMRKKTNNNKKEENKKTSLKKRKSESFLEKSKSGWLKTTRRGESLEGSIHEI